MRMGLEMVLLPVSDIDRAKSFYEQVGFDCDVDHDTPDMRIVQFTPPGSGCSIGFGRGLGGVSASPVIGLHLVVADLAAVLEDLRQRNVEVSQPFHFGPNGRMPGLHPDHPDYASFATFSDPDGNTWLLQEVPSRGD